MGLPTGRKVESAPERSDAQFGPLRAVTDELCAALRRNGVREIPEEQVVRQPGGRYWTDAESGEELEIILAFVDPASPDDANCVAFTVRDGLVVPFKRRGDPGQETITGLGGMGGSLVTGRERR
jgi:hypothetical protein